MIKTFTFTSRVLQMVRRAPIYLLALYFIKIGLSKGCFLFHSSIVTRWQYSSYDLLNNSPIYSTVPIFPWTKCQTTKSLLKLVFIVSLRTLYNFSKTWESALSMLVSIVIMTRSWSQHLSKLLQYMTCNTNGRISSSFVVLCMN